MIIMAKQIHDYDIIVIYIEIGKKKSAHSLTLTFL